MKNRPAAKHYKPAKPYVVPFDERVPLAVPFDEKELAKLFKARWDGERKYWYTTTRNVAKYPQTCRWMNPGEQKLWAKQRVEWLEKNDPSELVDINAFLVDGQKRAMDGATKATEQIISSVMATSSKGNFSAIIKSLS